MNKILKWRKKKIHAAEQKNFADSVRMLNCEKKKLNDGKSFLRAFQEAFSFGGSGSGKTRSFFIRLFKLTIT